jgi:hypothetical protein
VRRRPRSLPRGAQSTRIGRADARVRSRRQARLRRQLGGWPPGMGQCTSARSARTRHRTRSSPDRRSGCPRCIEPNAGNPVEVAPLVQPAQMQVLRVAADDCRGAIVRGAGRAGKDVALSQRTAACRRCLQAKRPFSRRLREKADTVGRRGSTPDAGSRERRGP